MADEKKEPKILVEQAQLPTVQAAVAAFTQEQLKKNTHDLLLKTTLADLQEASADAEIVKGTARPSGAWRHAPAQMEFQAIAEKRLKRCAIQAGMPVDKVERVYAWLIRGTKMLVVKAAPSTDLGAYEVNRYEGRSGCFINLLPLLGEAGLISDPGWKERFEVGYVPRGSQLWPGLCIDLGDPKERRRESTKKDEEKKSSTTKA